MPQTSRVRVTFFSTVTYGVGDVATEMFTAEDIARLRRALARRALVAIGSSQREIADSLGVSQPPLLQEAGDSLMMKLGEAAGRLARTNVEPPPGVVWESLCSDHRAEAGVSRRLSCLDGRARLGWAHWHGCRTWYWPGAAR